MNNHKGARPNRSEGKKDFGKPDSGGYKGRSNNSTGNKDDRPKSNNFTRSSDKPKRAGFSNDNFKKDGPKKEGFRKEDTRKDGFKRDNFKKDGFKKDNYRNAPRDIVEKDDYREDRLEGRNPVMEAIRSNRTIEKILVSNTQKEGSILKIIAMARDKGIIVQEVDKIKLDKMSQTGAHQGIIAYTSDYEYVDVDDILEKASSKEQHPFIIILDEINDPHNLGAIIRTAEVAGAHGVIIPKRRAVGVTSLVAKASAGAVEHMLISKVSNIAQTIDYLKKQGVWVVGADMDADKVYFEAQLTGPVAIVVGSEGEGIGQLIKNKCDFLVKIPVMGNISSLNASIAGGLLMYEILRQRNNG